VAWVALWGLAWAALAAVVEVIVAAETSVEVVVALVEQEDFDITTHNYHIF
jgi:hypothetical protein